uniref:Putative secreted protein n=1 Tax=Anopheles marajoara TaxID=58244 RepID=A0A2M4C7M5_9DIPT
MAMAKAMAIYLRQMAAASCSLSGGLTTATTTVASRSLDRNWMAIAEVAMVTRDFLFLFFVPSKRCGWNDPCSVLPRCEGGVKGVPRVHRLQRAPRAAAAAVTSFAIEGSFSSSL